MNTQQSTMPQRVVVGMSGGVDSTVTAALLKEQGFEVFGVSLRLWKAPLATECTDRTEQAESNASAVAEVLEIPLTILDLRERFYAQVVEPFLETYAQGQTPNPCVMCNPTFKFAALLDHADKIDAQWIATGHYARVEREPNGMSHLLRARYLQKDQSYALYRLTQRHLSQLLMPLGDIVSKTRVRQIAHEQNLPSADQEDSQDLCFMVGGDYRALLESVRAGILQPGPILNEVGEQLGEHRGLARYTIGQRGGLGVAAKERLYVLRFDTQANALIVGPRTSLARQACIIQHLSFTQEMPPAATFKAMGCIRYRAKRIPITVRLMGESQAYVRFKAPQYGVAPGQSLVFYQNDEVLGGGIIKT